MIVTGGQVYNSVTTRVYDDDGVEQWTANHGNSVRGVGFDADGNVYTGGDASSGISTRKYDPDGNLIWSINAGGSNFCLTTDAAGNVYVGGFISGGYSARKYDTDGNFLWGVNTGTYVNEICTDAAGNVYITGGTSGGFNTRKYDSSGNLLNSGLFFSVGQDIHVDSDGYIYICYEGGPSTTISHKKISPAFTLVFNGNAHQSMSGITTDSNSNIIVVGRSNPYTIYKYDSSGNLIWNVLTNRENKVVTDNSGNIYTAGYRYYVAFPTSATTSKFDPDGNFIWGADHIGTCYAIAHLASALITQIPALHLPISLGSIYSTAFTSIPALKIPINVKAPVSVGDEQTYDLPSIIGQQIYYAMVTVPGQSDLYRIEIRNIRCQRRVGASTWLTIETDYSDEANDFLQSSIGGQLVVFTGKRVGSGEEQTMVFLQSTITDVDHERTAYSPYISVMSRVTNPPFTSASRELIGVSRRDTVGNKYRIRCDVDPLLRPNDTATMGALSFTVDSIDYEISTHYAIMTVTGGN